MKTCRVCGALVDDREWNCPECGATMISSSGALSLKAEDPTVKKKKGGNRMGTTVSTGSGLTDILRAEESDNYDDTGELSSDFGGGSMPVSLSKNIIEEEEQRKKAKRTRTIISNVTKVVFLALVALAVYMFVTKVVLVERGASSYEELVDIYVQAINENDKELMLTIVPQFIDYRNDEAIELVNDLEGTTITGYNIKDTEEIDATTMNLLRDEIKLSTGKNANLDQGYYLTVEFTGKGEDGIAKTVAVDMEVYRVKDKWFLYPADYESPIF